MLPYGSNGSRGASRILFPPANEKEDTQSEPCVSFQEWVKGMRSISALGNRMRKDDIPCVRRRCHERLPHKRKKNRISRRCISGMIIRDKEYAPGSRQNPQRQLGQRRGHNFAKNARDLRRQRNTTLHTCWSSIPPFPVDRPMVEQTCANPKSDTFAPPS